MATIYHNLSSYDPASVPSGKNLRVGIVVADWNDNITYKLLDGAIETLKANQVDESDILVKHVPGSVELTYAAKYMVQNKMVDAVIVLGCVVRGDTPHFDYVCESVTQGVTLLNVNYDVPVIFGVLTTENMQQAEDRAGGNLGNKGDECAICAIKMAKLFAE